MFDYNKVYSEVIDYISDEYIEDYDINGVMDVLSGICYIDGDYTGPIRSIEDIGIDDVLEQFYMRGK